MSKWDTNLTSPAVSLWHKNVEQSEHLDKLRNLGLFILCGFSNIPFFLKFNHNIEHERKEGRKEGKKEGRKEGEEIGKRDTYLELPADST